MAENFQWFQTPLASAEIRNQYIPFNWESINSAYRTKLDTEKTRNAELDKILTFKDALSSVGFGEYTMPVNDYEELQKLKKNYQDRANSLVSLNVFSDEASKEMNKLKSDILTDKDLSRYAERNAKVQKYVENLRSMPNFVADPTQQLQINKYLKQYQDNPNFIGNELPEVLKPYSFQEISHGVGDNLANLEVQGTVSPTTNVLKTNLSSDIDTFANMLNYNPENKQNVSEVSPTIPDNKSLVDIFSDISSDVKKSYDNIDKVSSGVQHKKLNSYSYSIITHTPQQIYNVVHTALSEYDQQILNKATDELFKEGTIKNWDSPNDIEKELILERAINIKSNYEAATIWKFTAAELKDIPFHGGGGSGSGEKNNYPVMESIPLVVTKTNTPLSDYIKGKYKNISDTSLGMYTSPVITFVKGNAITDSFTNTIQSTFMEKGNLHTILKHLSPQLVNILSPSDPKGHSDAEIDEIINSYSPDIKITNLWASNNLGGLGTSISIEFNNLSQTTTSNGTLMPKKQSIYANIPVALLGNTNDNIYAWNRSQLSSVLSDINRESNLSKELNSKSGAVDMTNIIFSKSQNGINAARQTLFRPDVYEDLTKFFKNKSQNIVGIATRLPGDLIHNFNIRKESTGDLTIFYKEDSFNFTIKDYKIFSKNLYDKILNSAIILLAKENYSNLTQVR